MNAAATKMSEEQAVNLVRNALVVAGSEMGADGDHWPVIKSTVHTIANDYEKLKIERNVDAELKVHLYEQLAIMEKSLKTSSSEVQADVVPKLMQLREVYDAYFSSVAEEAVAVYENDMPVHLKRAKNIIHILGDENVD